MFPDTEPVHAWYAATGRHVVVTIALAAGAHWSWRKAVGWAKALLRRAHHLFAKTQVVCVERMVGTALCAFAHPTDRADTGEIVGLNLRRA
jgi:hypothetical protein